MTSTETRLIIEVALITMAFTGVLATGLWAYVQARRNTPGAVAELVASNDDIARRLRAMERGRESDHEMLLKMQTRLELQSAFGRAQTEYIGRQAAYSAMLADRLRQLGQDVPPAPGNPPMPPPELSTPLILRPVEPAGIENSLPGILAELFNNEELDDLAGRIGARPEDLIGETINRRAYSLVQWARRHRKLDKLASIARQLRPEGGI